MFFGNGWGIQAGMIVQGENQVAGNVGGFAIQGNGAAVGGDGLIKLPAFPQRNAEITEGVGQVGTKGDRPPKRGDGLVEPPSIPKCNAKIAVGFGKVRTQRRPPADTPPGPPRTVLYSSAQPQDCNGLLISPA